MQLVVFTHEKKKKMMYLGELCFAYGKFTKSLRIFKSKKLHKG